jgi:hypothetical protein
MPVQINRISVGALAALALAGCGSSHSTGSTTPHSSGHHGLPGTGGPTQPGGGKIGPEGIPVERGPSLAPASTTAPGTPVNGIHCLPSEQVVYHIHAHLQVFVDGQSRQIPGGVGIVEPVAQQTRYGPFFGATRCYYWLHTHTADGIIHIESPTQRVYTLGDFFAVWRQPLSSGAVAGARGAVVALVDGKPWTKSPAAIPLVSHAMIQLMVGRPLVPFQPVSFAHTGL